MNTPGTIFALGGLRLTAYGLMIGLGLLGGYWLAQRQAQRSGIRDAALQKVYLALLIGGLIGARAIYAVSNHGFYSTYPSAILRLWEGGYSMFGALLGAVAGLILAAGRRGWRRALDVLMPGLLLTMAVWRVGELTCWQGRGTILGRGHWLFFPFTVSNSQGLECLAICMYEAAAALLLLGYMLRGRSRVSGSRALTALMLLCLVQIPLESMRTDDFLALGFVKIDQLLAVIIAVAIMAYFLRGYLRSGRGAATAWIAMGLALGMVGMCIIEEFRIDGSANLALNYMMMCLYAAVMALCGIVLGTGWAAARASRKPQTVPSAKPAPAAVAPHWRNAAPTRINTPREAVGIEPRPASSSRAVEAYRAASAAARKRR